MWLKEIILIPNTTRHERTLLGSATVENLQEVKGKWGKLKFCSALVTLNQVGFFFKCNNLITNLFFFKLIYFLIAG